MSTSNGHSSDTRIPVVFYEHARDNHPKPNSYTWGELAELVLQRHATPTDVIKRLGWAEAKKLSKAFSPAEYREGATRGNDGVVRLYLLVGDMDHREPPWERLAPYDYFAYTTFSHTTWDPHWRVVVLLAAPVSATADWTEFWRRAQANVFAGALDEGTKDPARIHFYGEYPEGSTTDVRINVGHALDPGELPPAPDHDSGVSTDEADAVRAGLPKHPNGLPPHVDLSRLPADAITAIHEQVRESRFLDIHYVERTMFEHGYEPREVLAVLWDKRNGISDKPRNEWKWGGTRTEVARQWGKYLKDQPAETPPPDEGDWGVDPITDEVTDSRVGMLQCDAADLLDEEGDDELPYLPLLGVDGYLVEGWSHLIAGYPRVGKTELLVAMVEEWLRLGYRVLWFTEEPRTLWKFRLRKRGSYPRGLQLVFSLGRDPKELLNIMATADETIMLLDSIRNLLQPKDENDNSELARLINPWIVTARQTGKTPIFAHHDRKSGGSHGEGIAGGHALLGAVDIALEVLFDEHGVDNRRRIRAFPRVISPPEFLYERDRSTGTMRALSQPDESVAGGKDNGRLPNANELRVLKVASDLGARQATRGEIMKAAGAKPGSIDRFLKWLVSTGYLVRSDSLYSLTPAGIEAIEGLDSIAMEVVESLSRARARYTRDTRARVTREEVQKDHRDGHRDTIAMDGLLNHDTPSRWGDSRRDRPSDGVVMGPPPDGDGGSDGDGAPFIAYRGDASAIGWEINEKGNYLLRASRLVRLAPGEPDRLLATVFVRQKGKKAGDWAAYLEDQLVLTTWPTTSPPLADVYRLVLQRMRLPGLERMDFPEETA